MKLKAKNHVEEKRQAEIAKCMAIIPKPYKKTYEKAIAGKSLRAAVKAQCLDCVRWQKLEVRSCPSLACPLWAVRPYQEILQSARNERDLRAESTQTAIPVPR